MLKGCTVILIPEPPEITEPPDDARERQGGQYEVSEDIADTRCPTTIGLIVDEPYDSLL